MTKQKKHVGGNKEAQPKTSNSVTQEQQTQVLTPKDAEYTRYSDLLIGFFEKLLRWQEVLKAMGSKSYGNTHSIDVLSSSNGSYITPSTDEPRATYDPPDRILQIIDITELNDPEHGAFE